MSGQWNRLFVVVLAVAVLMFIGFPWYALITRPRDTIHPSDLVSTLTLATTGVLFKGHRTRALSATARQTINRPFSAPIGDLDARLPFSRRNCSHWAVVTTIFDPSDAVRGMARRQGWCLVVALDEGSKPYNLGDAAHADVVVLDAAAQKALAPLFPGFFEAMPWRHFARKNVGFLYAVMSGARYVWDFDDDNILKSGMDLSPPATATRVYTTRECSAFNPYPHMGLGNTSWPRGFPLNLVREPCPFAACPAVRTDDVAVFQSLADHEPDVDGVFRLTHHMPLYFAPCAKEPVTLARGTLTPYNAQATLYRDPGLWALLLPVSVHGRVSDIWRSYVAQRLLWDLGQTIAFLPPRVTQIRNPHNALADMHAEDPLYRQSLALVDVLQRWRAADDAAPIGRRFVELMVEMYERDFVGEKDVIATYEWISALHAVGYVFPTPVAGTGGPGTGTSYVESLASSAATTPCGSAL
eukprot:TRINITY_DN2559_c0_g2_i2.p1 TRINITY_DN2559_c0_g2~~TRINITY_DN2559_c0_g2_i2.p1  ORF type:complete len:469 (-),score=134.88 TRINITY_DN2559_c0_g2_i2:1-1407(-)